MYIDFWLGERELNIFDHRNASYRRTFFTYLYSSTVSGYMQDAIVISKECRKFLQNFRKYLCGIRVEVLVKNQKYRVLHENILWCE